MNRICRERVQRCDRLQELVDRQPVWDSDHRRRHRRRHRHRPQDAADRGPGFLGAAGRQQEPTHERDPDSIQDRACEKLEDPECDHQVREHAADLYRAVNSPLPAARPPPEERAEEAAAVERKGRDEIEHGEGDVDKRKPSEQIGNERGEGKQRKHQGEQRHRQARQRADARDQPFGTGARGLAIKP